LPGDRRAFGHPMRPLNVSECHFFCGSSARIAFAPTYASARLGVGV
jgi:hypothetical protein